MSNKPDIKFYYFPRACSLAVHIALEESGLEYARSLIDLRTNEHKSPTYLAVNPFGTVPALDVCGQVLTETHAILTYVGDSAPNGQLLPPIRHKDRYLAHQWMNFLSSSIHTSIRSIFRPSAYAPMKDEIAQAAVKCQGHRNLAKAAEIVEVWLSNTRFSMGEEYSVVDPYLFLMYLWSDDDRIDQLPARPKWRALAERVWDRPAVKKIVSIEQQDRDFTIPF